MSFRSYFLRSLYYGSAFAIGVGIGVAQWYFSRNDGEDELVEFRAMTNLNKTCRACIYEKRCCVRGENCSYAVLRWILDSINSAKETIDAALYLITCTEFKDAFIAAHKRGVDIRFISDYVMATGTGSAIPAFLKEGMNVRFSPNLERHMMHRKSIIIDKKFLLSGTANWTMQSLCGNWDGFVKTNNCNVVEKFLKAFELEWDQVDPEHNIQPVLAE